jgi:polysaccharide export outer membrane protein
MKTATFTALSLAALLGSAALVSAQAPQGPSPVGTSGAATAATAKPPAAASRSDYRLASGDKLRIEVYKDDQLSQSLQVRPDGKITLPLVGDVVAAGRTAIELRDSIVKSLEGEYMKDPTVTVIVTETTPQVVYVTGEVTKPGAVSLTGGSLSILQAIAMAGGFTDFANRKDITVLRGSQRLKFNYKDAIDDDNTRAPLQLQPGDTVIVK